MSRDLAPSPVPASGSSNGIERLWRRASAASTPWGAQAGRALREPWVAGTSATWRTWLGSAAGGVTVAFLAGRAVAWSFALLGAHGHLEPAFVEWDSLHYLSILHHGYAAHDNEQWAFYPLYPVLARTVALGVLISTVSFWGALLVVYLLGRDVLGERAARRAIWFMAFYPASFFFTAYFTDGLAVLLAAGAFLAATRRRPWIAAFLGLDAALTHGSTTIALAVPLLLIPQRVWWERLVAGAGPLLGVLAFFAFAWLVSGDPVATLHAERAWGHEWRGPFVAIWPAFHDVLATLAGESPVRWSYELGWLREVEFCALLGVIASTIWCLRRLPLAYGMYLVAFLFIALSTAWTEHPLSAFLRYLGALFPVFLCMGATFKGRAARVVLGAEAIGLAILSWRFGHGGWIG